MNNQLFIVLLSLLALAYAKKCCTLLEVEVRDPDLKLPLETQAELKKGLLPLQKLAGLYKYNETVDGRFHYVKKSDPKHQIRMLDWTIVIIYTLLYLGSLQIRVWIFRCPLKKLIICLVLNLYIYIYALIKCQLAQIV